MIFSCSHCGDEWEVAGRPKRGRCPMCGLLVERQEELIEIEEKENKDEKYD